MSIHPVDRRPLAWLIGLSLLIKLALLFYKGVLIGGDSNYYLAAADNIQKIGLQHYLDNRAVPYYWGYATFLAAMFSVVGVHYLAVVLMQIAVATVGVVVLYRIAQMLFADNRLAFLCGVLWLLNYDCFRWDLFVLTDSLGLSLAIFTAGCFVAANRALPNEKNPWLLAMVVLMVLLATVRTNSFVLIAVLLVTLWLQSTWRYKKIAALVFVIAVVAVLMFLYANANNTHSLVNRVTYYKKYFATGTIISGMPEYNYTVRGELTLSDILQMISIKFIYFWKVLVIRHSFKHQLFNGLYFYFLFPMALIGAVQVVRNRVKNAWFLIAVVLAYNIVQALTEVDFDWRYRIPVMPFVTLLAAYGCLQVWTGYALKWKKT